MGFNDEDVSELLLLIPEVEAQLGKLEAEVAELAGAEGELKQLLKIDPSRAVYAGPSGGVLFKQASAVGAVNDVREKLDRKLRERDAAKKRLETLVQKQMKKGKRGM